MNVPEINQDCLRTELRISIICIHNIPLQKLMPLLLKECCIPKYRKFANVFEDCSYD